jgi:hypothetical protein
LFAASATGAGNYLNADRRAISETGRLSQGYFLSVTLAHTDSLNNLSKSGALPLPENGK